ncbi:MAG: 2-dehydropantoate 2-reductase [Steroidobacter sp.]
MKQIAIIGPGAIGGTLTAWLSRNPEHEITVAARSAFETLTLQTPDGGVITATPRILTDPDKATPVDWVLVTTKAYDVAGTVLWLKKLVGPRTRIAVIQNGVEHVERFAPYVPVEQLLPVMIDCPAERQAPGRIRQRGPGRMVVPEGAHAQEFVNLFARTEFTVTPDANFKTQVWKKLCINSAGALSAVLLKPAIIARHDGVADIMRAIVRECIAVGRAEGAQLDDSIVDQVINGYRSAPPDSVNSLHADRAAGRPMETDARNGVIVRLGRTHGIPTPINQMMVALLEAAASNAPAVS